MFDQRGSVWRKWDLHVHTPASLTQEYGGEAGWERWLKEIEDLPAEYKVLGINDYLFLDGYKRVRHEKEENGRLDNIDLLLPVIEVRLDKFGGSRSSLSRVNFHIIFSNEIAAEVIETQFLAALFTEFTLTPQFEELGRNGRWAAVPTTASLTNLGELIIESVPEGKKADYGSPIEEGFNNLCFSMAKIRATLQSHFFIGRVLTAVGKTEWADVKWNDQSIADKKTIINEADLVFISTDAVTDYQSARDSLTQSSVNDRLLDCSDAHAFSDAATKDRIGNCRTWIKADPTFEGFRQAVIEFDSRVTISDDPPLAPPLRLKSATFSFPNDTVLRGEEHEDDFCFRGQHNVSFSPYFTCIVGGRGTGKSTILNLLNEKAFPKKNTFFANNSLVSPSSEISISQKVTVESTTPLETIEFLPQNDVEQFATDTSRFTPAIFSRIGKLDSDGALRALETQLTDSLERTNLHRDLLLSEDRNAKEIESAERRLASAHALVSSFKNQDYTKRNEKLSTLNKELKALSTWRERLTNLVDSADKLIQNYEIEPTEEQNEYQQRYFAILGAVKEALLIREPSVSNADRRVEELEPQIVEIKAGITEFLESRGLSPENLADVGKANETIAEIEQRLPAMRQKLEAARKSLKEYVSKPELTNEYRDAVIQLLTPINEKLNNLSAEVKPIELKYSFDVNSLRDRLVEFISEQLDPKPRVDHLQQALEGVQLVELTTRSDLLNEIPDSTKVGKSIHAHFSTELSFALLKLEVEREFLKVVSHRSIDVFYDGKPLESTSFGQRCTAAVVVLLLLGNTPIVIDEPESHLDSALIAKYLVNLVKDVKTNRQIIFATHNANFVVNGDSELIHVLVTRDDNKSEIVSTTIEDLGHRDKLLALEGGRAAFNRREKRYRENQM